MSDESSKGSRRVLEGRVISDRMDKTITVQVTRLVKHRRYHKYVTRRKNYKAHDEANECRVDDIVLIQESRPLSKSKRWTLLERRAALANSEDATTEVSP